MVRQLHIPKGELTGVRLRYVGWREVQAGLGGSRRCGRRPGTRRAAEIDSICPLVAIGAVAFAASSTLFHASSSHCAQSSSAFFRSSARCATNFLYLALSEFRSIRNPNLCENMISSVADRGITESHTTDRNRNR